MGAHRICGGSLKVWGLIEDVGAQWKCYGSLEMWKDMSSSKEIWWLIAAMLLLIEK